MHSAPSPRNAALEESPLTTPTVRRKQRFRLGLTLWLVTLVVVFALLLVPIQTNIGRWGIVFGAVGLWVGGLTLFWRSLVLRILFIAPFLLAGLLVFVPPVRTDVAALRGAYVRSLTGYEGTPYLWGGESRWGADCSGLLRRALIDALFSEGIRNRDLAELRTGAALWWYDASADALGREYQGRTVTQFDAASLIEVDYELLQPGDLAVVLSGKHILGYLGERRWIDADPKQKKTVLETVPSQTLWFTMPARIVRWRRLMDESVSTPARLR